MQFLPQVALSIFKSRLSNQLKIAAQNQFKTSEEISEIQNDKFIRIISHARKNVPYYSNILPPIRSINDISKIPFLTKKTIKSEFDTLKAKNIKKNHFISNSTSGSTGESMHFLSYKLNKYDEACAIRGDMMSGWEYGEKTVILWGAMRDINKQLKFYQRINKKFIQKYEFLSSFKMTNEDIANYVKFINEFKPALIIGYPTGLFLLSDYILTTKTTIYKPKSIISAGETIFPFQRQKIEEAFNRKVFNRYGCRDVYHIASECSEHNGLHISSDHVIIEVLDENGNPVESGKLGEIVITDLDNYAFPLIRYKIGDIGILKDSGFKCKCGVNLPMFEHIEGRTMDIIYGINGNKVTGTFWTLLFRHNFPGIEQFQVIQEDIKYLILNFVVNPQYRNEDSSIIIAEIQKTLGLSTRVEINILNEIGLSPTGKFRWIISKLA